MSSRGERGAAWPGVHPPLITASSSSARVSGVSPCNELTLLVVSITQLHLPAAAQSCARASRAMAGSDDCAGVSELSVTSVTPTVEATASVSVVAVCVLRK